MSRSMVSEVAEAVSAPVVRPHLLIELDFQPDPIRLWTGLGVYNWDNMEFFGAGELIGVGEITETMDISAVGLSLTLSGMPAALIAAIPNPAAFQGRAARIWVCAFNEAMILHEPPFQILGGLMDSLSYQEGEKITFALTVENRLADLERPRVRRLTDRDQQDMFPGDRFFEFVPSLQVAEVRWGRG